ncbi:MAG: response regulator [Opitutales bacterium]
MASPEQPSDADTQLPEAELGRLARFVAHDFKNFCMLLAGNAEMALRCRPSDPQVVAYLRNIIGGAQQARDLADRVLSHRRHCPNDESIHDLRGILNGLPDLLQSQLKPGQELNLDLPETPLWWQGCISRAQQVFLNLVVNALESMEDKAGEVSVTARLRGPMIRVSVEDDGPGVPPDRRETIFDAEQSTRGDSLHRGLGLAIVRHVTNTYGGRSFVTEGARGGACFIVELPVAQNGQGAGSQSAASSPELAPAGDSAHKRNVLFVEDDPSMRTLGMDMLQMLNCRVTVASDGQEAWQIFEGASDYFDAVISDSRMPNMSGSQLARRVREQRPKLPFILVTAFNDAATGREVERLGIREILPKPFMLEDLERTLERVFGK